MSLELTRARFQWKYIFSMLTAVPRVLAICECGYVLSNVTLFTSYSLTNFSLPSTAAMFEQNQTDWYARFWDRVTPKFSMFVDPNNVFAQLGLLNIRTEAYPQGNDIKETPIRTGQIRTFENQILYGSFRATFQVTKVPGAVAGFFFYKDGQQ